MKIEDVLCNARSFQEVLQVAENARSSVSFWGTKYITVPGMGGWLDIDALAEKTLDLVEKNPEFSGEERILGKKIAQRIDRIYADKISQLKESNYLTKVICVIRALYQYIFVHWGYSTEFMWGRYYNDIFDSYTAEQYRQAFRTDPPANFLASSHLDNVPRWMRPIRT